MESKRMIDVLDDVQKATKAADKLEESLTECVQYKNSVTIASNFNQGVGAVKPELARAIAAAERAQRVAESKNAMTVAAEFARTIAAARLALARLDVAIDTAAEFLIAADDDSEGCS